MKTYMILADFFFEDGSRNFSWEKIKSLSEAAERNGVTALGLNHEPGDVSCFLFKTDRKRMIGMVFDLVYVNGILEEDLLEDFDAAFEVR